MQRETRGELTSLGAPTRERWRICCSHIPAVQDTFEGLVAPGAEKRDTLGASVVHTPTKGFRMHSETLGPLVALEA